MLTKSSCTLKTRPWVLNRFSGEKRGSPKAVKHPISAPGHFVIQFDVMLKRLSDWLVFCFLLISLSNTCFSQEKHLRNIRQLTFGGENAEAYFSADGKRLIFQSTRDGYPCDQIYTMKTDGSDLTKLSQGIGRTTCSYFFPDEQHILYSSTHHVSDDCPAQPDRQRGYVWGLYPYDIFRTPSDGTGLRPLAASPGYDAEATISADGARIVFTSDRDGDLELYTMDADGKNITRLTNSLGYDGGAFFSPDAKKIVFRARVITEAQELQEYRDLLKVNLVRPSKLEIFVMNADGSGRAQVTHNNAANFCPFFHPDGKRIIFASNMNDPAQRNFDLYLLNADGTGLEQITFNPTFDGFPMFSPDGKQLVFASNRNAKTPGETNIFIADWIESPVEINHSNIKRDVTFLASDEMQGRLTGTPEARKAAEYIARQFRESGLVHPPGMNSPYQQFEFTSGIKLGITNTLAMKSTTSRTEYQVGNDFIPTGFSEDAVIDNAPVVFAGYGIRTQDLKTDDYEGVDVKGKVVLCYNYGPEGDDPKSPYSTYYPIRYKAMTAREHGASALLIVSQTPDDDELLALRKDSSFGTAGIPVISIKRSVVTQWLQSAGVRYPDPENHDAMSFTLPNVTVSLKTNLVREKNKSDNVLGWLPAGKTTHETIVIGAHYDHLGLGIEGSLASRWGSVHNGADDNASGVAGLLELARYFSAPRPAPHRNILFIAFGGEELGVLGSTFYVKNPPFPLSNIVTMLNMDMIGRLRNKKLIVGGTGTSPSWNTILQEANTDGIKLTLNENGYGPSDHASYYARNIPVLFFFTGAHSEYHKPEDDAGLIEYDGLVTVTNYIARIVEKIDDLPAPPEFVRAKPGTQEAASRGFRVYLGTIPDYTEEVKGVKLTGVREESPSEKAGIKAGDIIVTLGDKTIENVYDYTYALQSFKPGDTATVVVLRDGQRISLPVTFEKKSQ